jgi:hypothetical protein
MDSCKQYWCQRCSKKYLMPAEILKSNLRSPLQDKVPFLDPENNKMTKSSYNTRSEQRKCLVCGFVMKEIEDVESDNSP